MKDELYLEEEKNLKKNLELIDEEIEYQESLEEKFLHEAESLPSKDNEYRKEYRDRKFDAENTRQEALALKEIRKEPYFAHMSFDIEGEGNEDIFIGDHSVVDSNINQIVCDWRAEIPGLYYLNQKSYIHNSKKYEIVYKRQIDIKNSQLQTVNESRYKAKSSFAKQDDKEYEVLEKESNMIYDEFLQNKLKENAFSPEFRDIISTIQANQYKIITADPKRSMIVQGVAGSGKTAIILHRLSYLFYNYKDIKPNRTVYISPSKMLIENMDNLSIKLGIDKIKMMTLGEYYLDKLNAVYQKKFSGISNKAKNNSYEEFSDDYFNAMYEYIANRYKAEYENIVSLCNIEGKYTNRKDFSRLETKLSEVKIDYEKRLSSLWNTVDPQRKLKNKLKLSYTNLDDVKKEIKEKLKTGIDGYYYQKCNEVIEEMSKLKNELDNANKGLRYLNSFRSIDVLFGYYCDYLDDIDKETANNLREKYDKIDKKDNGKISRIDAYSLLNLAQKFEYNIINEYDYAYIDEAQDYNDNEVLLIQKLENNCIMNIYGDVYQNIYPNVYKKSDWSNLEEKVVGQIDTYKTVENYRNPREIVELCDKELGIKMTSINNNSNVTQSFEYNELDDIIDDLNKESIIICNDKKYLGELKSNFDKVYTVYEVKGMEFVNVTVIEDETWTNEMKYIAYTRSLNALTVYKKGKKMK